MTLPLSMLVGAALLAVFGPALLGGLERSRVPPAFVLMCWWTTIAGVVTTVVASLGLLLLPDHAGQSGIGRLTDLCVAALAHARNAWTETVLSAIVAVGLLIVILRSVVATRRASRRRRLLDDHLRLLTLIGQREDGVLWIPHPRPLAFSVSGRRALIVASSALVEQLPPGAVAAVLAHERAHLRGRHHLQVAVAEALGAALPVVPLFGRAPTAVRRLVEFTADASAAHRHGSEKLSNALRVLAGSTSPPGTLAASGDDAQQRLARLDEMATQSSAHTWPALAVAFLPAWAAIIIPAGIATIACA